VDEYSPCRPKRAGGAAHLAAEAVLRSHRPGGGSTILRLAGIYGPGRLPRFAEIRTGQLLEGADDGFLNLIHADDAAAAAVAALSGPTREPIYVISDGSPVRRRDFYSELGRLVGAPAMLPSGTASGMVRRPRGENSKRVWNRRMRRDLLPRLAYPDYRCGLRQALSLRSMAAAGDQA
jgi:nucleoside-diphosphate-sugar epimerase